VVPRTNSGHCLEDGNGFYSAGQEVDFYVEFRLVSILRGTGRVIVLSCCNYDRIKCEVMWCTENLQRLKSPKGK